MTRFDSDSRESGTGTALVAAATPASRASFRVVPEASFLSQLIAERDRLPPQRVKRQATVAVAVGSYVAGSHIADRRLPAGYRRTLIA